MNHGTEGYAQDNSSLLDPISTEENYNSFDKLSKENLILRKENLDLKSKLSYIRDIINRII